MKRWGYGINSYHKTASIYLDEAPLAVFALETFIAFVCYHIPSVPLPKIPFMLRGEDIEFNDGKVWTTLRDWYGDLRQVFCAHIHMPIDDFCWSRIKSRIVETPYDKVKEWFYEKDKEFWDAGIEACEEIIRDNADQ